LIVGPTCDDPIEVTLDAAGQLGLFGFSTRELESLLKKFKQDPDLSESKTVAEAVNSYAAVSFDICGSLRSSSTDDFEQVSVLCSNLVDDIKCFAAGLGFSEQEFVRKFFQNHVFTLRQ
jgi:hypothetical protein